jgi:hypothetical protein
MKMKERESKKESQPLEFARLVNMMTPKFGNSHNIRKVIREFVETGDTSPLSLLEEKLSKLVPNLKILSIRDIGESSSFSKISLSGKVPESPATNRFIEIKNKLDSDWRLVEAANLIEAEDFEKSKKEVATSKRREVIREMDSFVAKKKESKRFAAELERKEWEQLVIEAETFVESKKASEIMKKNCARAEYEESARIINQRSVEARLREQAKKIEDLAENERVRLEQAKERSRERERRTGERVRLERCAQIVQ